MADNHEALNAEMAKLQAEMQAITIRQLASLCAELRLENAALKQALEAKGAGSAAAADPA